MRCLLACALAFLGASCEGVEQQLTFEAHAFAPPVGFTRTTEGGEVLSSDDDDWRTAPAYQSRITVDPAFPNPPGTSPTISVPFRVYDFNAILGRLDLVLFDADRIARRLDSVNNARDPGVYVFKFSPGLIGQTGLVRVYIVDTAGTLVSYGDLSMES